MTTASNLADELERAEDFLNDPNKFAISRRLRDRILSALRRVEPGSDQPRPSVSEDQGSSRDHALTDSVALDGEHFGPWRVWFDPPPIGTRECDWHYQHEDAEPECPAWMHGHCASRDACIAEIIDGYEERA